ncbi:hypothetical protein GmHk_06G017144 [Glycine max]|nr:hypothetical protein GmHk_06G017144 [Glycine max]
MKVPKNRVRVYRFSHYKECGASRSPFSPFIFSEIKTRVLPLCRNLSFGERATQGSRVRLPREEGV